MLKYSPMDKTTFLGLAAGALTTFSLLPQLIKTLKEKSAKDISIGMYITLCLGLLFWIFYGLLIDSAPVILANVVSIILAIAVLLLKIRYG
jgi:MtN3 and saliva related transmembrane protein